MSLQSLTIALVTLGSLAPPEVVSPTPPSPSDSRPASVKPARNAAFRTISLQHASSAETAALLAGALQPEAGAGPFVFHDKRTNTIILHGDEGLLAEACALIQTLDRPSVSATEAPFESRLEVSVFELLLPAERAAALEVSQLNASAATTATLQEALAEYGTVRLLHRFSQTVSTIRDNKLANDTNVPFVRGSQIDSTGNVCSQVQYEDTGCRVEVDCNWPSADYTFGHALVRVDVSMLGKSPLELVKGTNAPVFRNIKQQYNGAFAADRPYLLLSMDSEGNPDTLSAYVTRLVFRRVPLQAE